MKTLHKLDQSESLLH